MKKRRPQRSYAPSNNTPQKTSEESSSKSSGFKVFFKSLYDSSYKYFETSTLDPLKEEIADIKLRPIDSINKIITLALAFVVSFMLWKAIMLYTNSSSPIVVVLSGSMEPAFKRGDILFLDNHKPPNAGDVVVFEIEGRDIPIVHRLMSIHTSSHNKTQYLTKGDNNNVDDRGLYANNDMWLYPETLLGEAKGKIPYVGYFTIWLNDRPPIKYGILALTSLMVITGNS